MSNEYVFDTEAIIAYLYKEPGHDIVADLLDEVFSGEDNGFLTETNASEVFITNVMEDLTVLLCVAMSLNFVSNGLDLCS